MTTLHYSNTLSNNTFTVMKEDDDGFIDVSHEPKITRHDVLTILSFMKPKTRNRIRLFPNIKARKHEASEWIARHQNTLYYEQFCLQEAYVEILYQMMRPYMGKPSDHRVTDSKEINYLNFIKGRTERWLELSPPTKAHRTDSLQMYNIRFLTNKLTRN